MAGRTSIVGCCENKIDNTPGYGQFILTGSTSINNDEIMHTGTGRVSRMTMLPMSLYEQGI